MTTGLRTIIDVRPARERMHTSISWLDSWHSFSFGGHFDPANTHHGLLLVSNDDTVVPGGGFGEHGHSDREIVTWGLAGAVEHRDTLGTRGVITPGMAQRMSAGAGIRHAEMNASAEAPVHFVQMWVPPDTAGIAPGYEERDLTPDLAGGSLVAVASGRGDAALRIQQRDAALWAARLPAGGEALLPDAPFVHLFVATGAVSAEGVPGPADDGPLSAGDAVRLTAAGPRRVTAGPSGAEILVWEMARDGA